jgi:hypothetical protein
MTGSRECAEDDRVGCDASPASAQEHDGKVKVFFYIPTDKTTDLYSSYMDPDPEPDPNAQNGAFCQKCKLIFGFCIICNIFQPLKCNWPSHEGKIKTAKNF